MKYQYKVVPFIGQSTGQVSPAEVATQLETVIGDYVARGWEFYQLSDVNVEVQPGCIAGLLGAKAHYARFDQLIFRAEREVIEPISQAERTALSESRSIQPSQSSDKPTGRNAEADVDNQDSLSYCYHCGADVPAGSRNCAECGKSL